MVTSKRRFELIAFGFAVALSVFVEYLGHRSASALVETAGWVEHTRHVIEELDAVLIATLDAETSWRGYALSGEEPLLVPYRDAAERASAHMAAIRRLSADNDAQRSRLDALEPRVKARLARLDDAIAVRRKAGPEFRATPAGVLRGHGDMAEIRSTIAEMTDAERRLLEERTLRSRESVVDSHNVQLAGGALSIALLTLIVFRLRRSIRQVEESEEKVRVNEEDLATTLESIGDGVIATDAEGRVTRMNPVARQITGWDLAAAQNQPIADVFRLVHEVTSGDSPHPVERAMREGTVVAIDDTSILVAKDGTRRRVADSAAPIRDRNGNVRGAVLVFHDITKTLEAARSLRRAHAFVDSIVENIPDMIFVKDAQELSFVRLNRAGEALLGLARDELVGKTDFAFFPPDQAKAFVDKDRETLRGKTMIEILEEPLATARGVRWLRTRKVPIIDENGEPEYLLGISSDITDRRRADALLRASKDATEVAHHELESFSYSVAHDLRTPLRSIDGFSQALLEDYGDRLDDQGKDYLTRVRNAARRMAELIDDLLGLARVSRSELTRGPIDISAIAREVGELARKDLNPKAELIVAERLTADADARLVRVLLENLLSNAFKFSRLRDDARIEVGSTAMDGVRTFFVTDNGVGFDQGSANKLFTAFQRYHRPTEYEGIGIGLATAERIVRRHGGRLWAESSPGAGATFRFILQPKEQA